jgi:hypothetical protein
VIDQLPAVSAKLGSLPIGFPALRTSGLKTRPTLVAKNRGKRILGPTLRADHNGNQSQIDYIVPNSIKADVRERIEGNRQTSVYYRAGLKASKSIVVSTVAAETTCSTI